MTTSSRPSTQPWQSSETGSSLPHTDIFAGILAFMSFLGFLDASYLTAEHFFTLPLPCSFTHGCETVLTSSYATVAGIPVALFGVLYYLTILFCAVYLLTSGEKNLSVVKFVLGITALGLAMSTVFLYLQLFVIHALCMYCLGSALTTLTLFIASILIKRSMRTRIGIGRV